MLRSVFFTLVVALSVATQAAAQQPVADIKNCLNNPAASIAGNIAFGSGPASIKVINAFYNGGACLYGNYCGQKCMGATNSKLKPVDALDKCCQPFLKAGISYKAFSTFSDCYQNVDTNVCVCNGQQQPDVSKCLGSTKGCTLQASKNKAFVSAWNAFDQAIGDEETGGLAYCFNGHSGGDGEGGK